VRALANSIIVLRHGKVVEQGPSQLVFAEPKTAYTKALLAAAFELEATRGGAVHLADSRNSRLLPDVAKGTTPLNTEVNPCVACFCG
jgi:ABC-type dipeptide/oligopeptide/nickel transport system ATPase component